MSATRGHLIDLSPLRTSPAFARMWIGSTLAGVGGQLTIVTVMLHVFDLTAPAARSREDALADAGFAPLAELASQADAFETWSQFVLSELGRS